MCVYIFPSPTISVFSPNDYYYCIKRTIKMTITPKRKTNIIVLRKFVVSMTTLAAFTSAKINREKNDNNSVSFKLNIIMSNYMTY